MRIIFRQLRFFDFQLILNDRDLIRLVYGEIGNTLCYEGKNQVPGSTINTDDVAKKEKKIHCIFFLSPFMFLYSLLRSFF